MAKATETRLQEIRTDTAFQVAQKTGQDFTKVQARMKAELEEEKQLRAERAKYKIEVIFDRNRSTIAPSAFGLIIWESGKMFHGGGDQKMYWCPYDACGKPMTVDNFAYLHAVCPSCLREMFLDPEARQAHLDYLKLENKPLKGIDKIPMIVGERFGKMSPPRLAELLEKTFRSLESCADIYLKYSPFEIRYDVLNETSKDIDNLHNVRVQRKPLIYLWKAIMKDVSAGADLRKRLESMLRA